MSWDSITCWWKVARFPPFALVLQNCPLAALVMEHLDPTGQMRVGSLSRPAGKFRQSGPKRLPWSRRLAGHKAQWSSSGTCLEAIRRRPHPKAPFFPWLHSNQSHARSVKGTPRFIQFLSFTPSRTNISPGFFSGSGGWHPFFHSKPCKKGDPWLGYSASCRREVQFT